MIVRFDTEAGTLTMHGDAATRLLRLMGHSGTVPGAILAADLPASLEALRAGLASAETATPSAEIRAATPDEEQDDDEEREPPVDLRTRAVPFLDMLETAVKGKSGLMWDRG
jgi:Domain of unknown function (DUF1840)